MKRIVLVLVLICAASLIVAQDDEIDYSKIPQSRLEDGGFVLGDPDAPVTVIEFSDFLCPHCQEYEEVTQQFIRDYVVTGKAKFEYRLATIIDGTYSPLFATMSECAGESGLFWESHDVLFQMAREREVDANSVDTFAQRMGIDVDDLKTCMETADQYVEDGLLMNDLGVTGTPAIRVRAGDGEPGAVAIDGQVLARGGLALESLQAFVEGDNPEEMVQQLNQLRNDAYLHDDSLVSEESCGANCWQDIIPGETTWDDAVAHLEEIEGITPLDVQVSSDGQSAGVAFQTEDGDVCCEMLTLDLQTVTYVRILLVPEHTLGEVIAARGDPTYMIVHEITRSQTLIALVYPENAALIYAFMPSVDVGEISAENEIIGFQYYDAALMPSLLSGLTVYEWDGYKPFQEYVDTGQITLP